MADDDNNEQNDLLHDEAPENDTEKTIVFEPDYQNSDYSESLSDIDLFSDNASLPEMSYLDDAEIPALDFEAVDMDNSQFDGTLFDDVSLEYADNDLPGQVASSSVEPGYEDVVSTGDQNADDQAMDHDPVDETFNSAIYSDDMVSLNSPRLWIKRLSMAFVLMTVFGGGFIYANRAKYHDSTVLAPLVRIVCVVAACGTDAYPNLEDLVVVRRDVYSHPKVDNALIINIVFQNVAETKQPYPILEISMSDVNGTIVARRDFLPIEYLNTVDATTLSDIASLETVDLNLEVIDPGEDARSFELNFK